MFVPVVFAFLPDKKRYETETKNIVFFISLALINRRSYDDLFGLLRQTLEHHSRRLSLSAEWFMSDFENNIRKSWAENFPSVSPKGCHFHFAKAIWSIVKKMGMKSQYSAANKNPKFGTFIRCVIGLPFVPLERLNEGFQNLEKSGRKVKGQKSKDFVKYLLDYIERVWKQPIYQLPENFI